MTEEVVKTFIESLGYDLNDIHLKDTPKRFAEAMRWLTAGERMDIDSLFTVFEEDEADVYNGMVILKHIPFYSLCSHHMLPFFGEVHVGYIPIDGKIVGISKLARIVDVFARRLQVQERMTKQIADVLMEKLTPKGVIVVVEAIHLCMRMRGVQKENSIMTTSSVKGVFEDKPTRDEFLSLLQSTLVKS